MPVVDDDGNTIDVRELWSLQTEAQQQLTLTLIDVYREELEDEHGGFVIRSMPSGRVLIEPGIGEPYICYLHDPTDPAPFLCVDDFTPEIWEEWWPKEELPPKGRQQKQI